MHSGTCTLITAVAMAVGLIMPPPPCPMFRSYFCKFKGASIAVAVDEVGATINTDVASLSRPAVVELVGGE